MKKQNGNFGINLSMLVIVLLFISNSSFAQKNYLKVNTNINQHYGVSFERMVTPQIALGANINKYEINGNGFLSINNNYYQSGTRFGLESKFFATKRKKQGTGFYATPHINMGKHKVRYEKYTSSGLGLGLIFATIDVVADGSLDNPIYLKTPEKVTGNAEVNVLGAGLKIGYQNRISFLTFDFGLDLNSNQVLNGPNKLQLNNGNTKAFDQTTQGRNAALYAGLGINF